MNSNAYIHLDIKIPSVKWFDKNISFISLHKD